MNIYLDCVPCIARQAVEAAQMATTDEKLREKVIRAALAAVAELPFETTPPHMGVAIHGIVNRLVGDVDPYLELKRSYNKKALEIYPWLKELVRRSDDPLRTAVTVAIAGNLIDFGVQNSGDGIHLRRITEDTLSSPFAVDHFTPFREAVLSGGRILYIADNAGEIVFDRVLIEEIPDFRSRVTFAVKGGHVLNDATIEDVRETAMDGIVRVIDNGNDAPGTIVEMCSAPFVEELNGAAVVIAKGQGNYETLSGTGYPVFFLLRAKCGVIARHIGVPKGGIVLKKNDAAR